MNELSKTEFDKHAVSYRQIHNNNIKFSGTDSAYFSSYKVEEIFSQEQEKSSIRIFDFGCGDGTSLKYFRNYFPESELHGVDVSRKSIIIPLKIDIGVMSSFFRTFFGLLLES